MNHPVAVSLPASRGTARRPAPPDAPRRPDEAVPVRRALSDARQSH